MPGARASSSLRESRDRTHPAAAWEKGQFGHEARWETRMRKRQSHPSGCGNPVEWLSSNFQDLDQGMTRGTEKDFGGEMPSPLCLRHPNPHLPSGWVVISHGRAFQSATLCLKTFDRPWSEQNSSSSPNGLCSNSAKIFLHVFQTTWYASYLSLHRLSPRL